jgi:hypothetical protein
MIEESMPSQHSDMQAPFTLTGKDMLLDNQLYDEILGLFSPEAPHPEPAPTAPQAEVMPVHREPYHPPPRQYAMRDITGGRKPRHISSQVSDAAHLFVDMLNNPEFDPSVKSRLAQIVAESDWQSLPDDRAINFFAVLRHDYLLTGKQPQRRRGLHLGENQQ